MSLTLTDRVHAVIADENNDPLRAAAHAPVTECTAALERHLDLVDWGMVLGVAFGIARGEDPYEQHHDVVCRAEHAARQVWAHFHSSSDLLADTPAVMS